jgi:hypothetical protein
MIKLSSKANYLKSIIMPISINITNKILNYYSLLNPDMILLNCEDLNLILNSYYIRICFYYRYLENYRISKFNLKLILTEIQKSLNIVMELTWRI